jgi:hypothetical protein
MLAAPAVAQDAAPEPEPRPRFAVELLVFQHLDQTRSTAEIAPPPNPYADVPEGAAKLPPGPELTFLLLDPASDPFAIQALPVGERALASAWARLERLDAYRPLAYLSWSQTTTGRSAARSFWLDEVGVIPPGLQGQVTLYKERYLHLALDLEWAGVPTDTTGVMDAAPAARIEESRRLRGDVVQYFDNPQFGAIAYVRELQAPEELPGPAG